MSKSQVTFYCDDSVLSAFKARYPRLLSDFVRKCLIKSLDDKVFFDSVFFGSISLSSPSSSSSLSSSSSNVESFDSPF